MDIPTTSRRSHLCEICGKGFHSQLNLLCHKRTHDTKHLRNHKGKKSFSCGICQKKFTRSDNLKTHMRTHTGEKPFTCDICQQKFIQDIHLQRHIRTHTRERPFTCDICQQKFIQDIHLQRHIRTHTREKPFTCDICQLKLTRNDTLIRHMKKHAGGHVCRICGLEFGRNGFLKHLKTHIDKEVRFCEYCGYTFFNDLGFEQHQQVHLGCPKPYRCLICGEAFDTSAASRDHKQGHGFEYTCTTCQEGFFHKQNVAFHIRTCCPKWKSEDRNEDDDDDDDDDE